VHKAICEMDEQQQALEKKLKEEELKQKNRLEAQKRREEAQLKRKKMLEEQQERERKRVETENQVAKFFVGKPYVGAQKQVADHDTITDKHELVSETVKVTEKHETEPETENNEVDMNGTVLHTTVQEENYTSEEVAELVNEVTPTIEEYHEPVKEDENTTHTHDTTDTAHRNEEKIDTENVINEPVISSATEEHTHDREAIEQTLTVEEAEIIDDPDISEIEQPDFSQTEVQTTEETKIETNKEETQETKVVEVSCSFKDYSINKKDVLVYSRGMPTGIKEGSPLKKSQQLRGKGTLTSHEKKMVFQAGSAAVSFSKNQLASVRVKNSTDTTLDDSNKRYLIALQFNKKTEEKKRSNEAHHIEMEINGSPELATIMSRISDKINKLLS
jgi:hypothetical protein